jgi:hypothetical protein
MMKHFFKKKCREFPKIAKKMFFPGTPWFGIGIFLPDAFKYVVVVGLVLRVSETTYDGTGTYRTSTYIHHHVRE